MSVVVVGLNHRTVPLDLLERMTVNEARLPKALHDLCSRDEIGEAVLLSTCNRTEVYAVVERFHPAYQDIRNFLSDLAYLPPDAFSDHLYTHYDDEAVEHLFGVAAGLDSAVLGESEILGQVKGAWELAQSEQAAGPSLNMLFRHALEVGKRARTETGIARHITSVAQAAVAMATERLGTLAGTRILVLGAGDMGRGMVAALAEADAADPPELLVANRTWAKAEELAARVGGRAVHVDDVPSVLADVDVLLTSTGASSIMFEQADLAPGLERRSGRPLLIVDIAVPRDIDPSVGGIDGVTLLDMDDLRVFAEAGLAQRRREVHAVDHIVGDEVERYLAVSTAREVAPLVTAVRDRAEEIRLAELERHRAKLDALGEREREAVEALTRGILAKLLHEPTVRLKDAAGTPRGERLAESLRTLFDL
ncbi:MAG: glutamyl-tRNA reductase [Microthrixaceae bacterium]|nr:glutamyl-tRNA reductase [Microthrixaceae bacterium]